MHNADVFETFRREKITPLLYFRVIMAFKICFDDHVFLANALRYVNLVFYSTSAHLRSEFWKILPLSLGFIVLRTVFAASFATIMREPLIEPL